MMWQAGDILLTGPIEADEMFLKLMDALLKGGLTGRRFTLFGDFTSQNKEEGTIFEPLSLICQVVKMLCELGPVSPIVHNLALLPTRNTFGR